MTDPQNWHPPTTDERDTPRYGEYGPPSGGPGQPWSGGPPAWAPPPRPGLIPLRPLGFGTLLWAPFQLLRRNPKATFGSALIVQAAVALLTLVVVGPVSLWALGRIDNAPLAERDAVEAGSFLAIALSAIVPIALSVVAAALLQGVIVIEVARATLGEKLRLGALWRSAGRRLWPLVLWTLLLSGALLAATVILVAGVALLVALGGSWLALAVAIGVLGALALVAASAWVSTKTALVPSAIVLERFGIGRAVQRSWSLTTGYFWRTLGALFLVSAIVSIVSQIVTTPVSLLLGVGAALLDPTEAYPVATTSALVVISLLISIPVSAVTAVVQSGVTALIYLDLRMRKEGLDLELARFVESGQTGAAVADPYLPPPADGTAAPAA